MNASDFLREIIASPDDDVPRLVYADWLDDQDDPRGEFIRVQFELARLPKDDPSRERLRVREAELLHAHEQSWVAEACEQSWAQLDELALFFEWKRGFISVVKPAARGVWGDNLKHLAKFPLTEELEFTFVMGDDEFRHMPDLSYLQTLRVGGNSRITDASIPKISNWHTIRRLCLQCDEITDAALPDLAKLNELRELDLSYSRITDTAFYQLSTITSLESLYVSYTEITGEGSAALRSLPRLRCLSMTNTRIWEYGTGGLVGCQRLEEVRLHSDLLEHVYVDEDLMPLLELPALKVLELGWSLPTENFLHALRQRNAERVFWLNGERLQRST